MFMIGFSSLPRIGKVLLGDEMTLLESCKINKGRVFDAKIAGASLFNFFRTKFKQVLR